MSLKEKCFQVVVVSDRVYEGVESDTSGELALNFLREKGLCVNPKIVIKNSYREIIKVVRDSDARVLIFLGGTGPSPRDITVDVLENIAWRCMPGFGEVFRQLSYSKVGPKAILSRTTLCILHDGKVVVALPGSPDGASLGVDLLLKVVGHLLDEVDRFETPHKHSH